MTGDKHLIHSEIILYQIEDGRNKIEVRLENETVWLTQQLMAVDEPSRLVRTRRDASSTMGNVEVVQGSRLPESRKSLGIAGGTSASLSACSGVCESLPQIGAAMQDSPVLAEIMPILRSPPGESATPPRGNSQGFLVGSPGRGAERKKTPSKRKGGQR